MSKAGRQVLRGLGEAVAHAKGARTEVVVHAPKETDVRKFRLSLGMSQSEFAENFGISLCEIQKRKTRKPRP